MSVATKIVELLTAKTKDAPAFMHFDPIGLIRLDDTNEGRLRAFSTILCRTQDSGGSLLIPAYSYSYTKKEPFFVQNSECTLGSASEHLRKLNRQRRTFDGLFSYLSFSNQLSSKHFEVRDLESFGDDSLIAEVFSKNGYLTTIGNQFHCSTEIHFLERLLGVDYRFNKTFSGTLVNSDGSEYLQSIKYFCRKLELKLKPSLIALVNDLRQDGLFEVWDIEDAFFVEAIRFNTLYEYLRKKLKVNPRYLCLPE